MSQTTQGHHPLQFKNAWRQFIAENLRVKQMTKRALCRRAAIDPSYVTLFCRDGYIPKRDVVERVGLALGSIDEALRAAGYLEDGVPHDTPSLAGLSQESLRLLSALASLPQKDQDQATLTLRLALPTLLASQCGPKTQQEVA